LGDLGFIENFGAHESGPKVRRTYSKILVNTAMSAFGPKRTS
jgi:hypothetical protein